MMGEELELISHNLSTDIAKNCMTEKFSDVVLVVETERLCCHKVILASRSEYFNALFTSGLRETHQNEIVLQGTSIAAFKPLLQYAYSGRLSLHEYREDFDLILEILGLAHMYQFPALVQDMKTYLAKTIDKNNVCHIFDSSRIYEFSDLSTVCLSFMDLCATVILESEAFLSITPSSFRELLLRDTFYAPEIKIFQAVRRWLDRNKPSDSVRSDILSGVRLSLISEIDILEKVRPTGLFSMEELLNALEKRIVKGTDELELRGYKCPDEDVVLESSWYSHPDPKHDEWGDNRLYLVTLKRPSLINHMCLLLPEGNHSYEINASALKNCANGPIVIDHFLHVCQGKQRLYFKPITAEYIMIKFTKPVEGSPEIKVQVYYHEVMPKLIHPDNVVRDERIMIPFPGENVATQEMGAITGQPVLIDGRIDNYTDDSGHAYHTIGKDPLVIQLAQPYYIDSMRLLLWDQDDRSYSYYIETSCNEKDWSMAVNKRAEDCKSWQTLRFPGRAVVFIRIVGTHNTADEWFDCVHFECPAASGQEDNKEPKESKEK